MNEEVFKRKRRDHYLGLDDTPLGSNEYTDEQITDIVNQEWIDYINGEDK